MNFKFFENNTIENNSMVFTTHRFEPENVEFCFQFGDGEPVVFATGPNECSIRLSPQSNTNMSFRDNDGNRFKLFAREVQNG